MTAAVGTSTARLSARGVTVRFGGLTALREMDIDVPAGTITGLIGPNGAGKSTLFSVLSGLRKPSAGQVFMDGIEVTGASPQRRAKAGLARTFQHPELFTGLTVREHIVLAYRVKNAPRRAMTDLVTGGGFRRSPQAEDARVERLIDGFHLSAIQHEPVVGLPLGMARLVEIARSLACEPNVLLLDEASSGLDAVETEQLAGSLRRLVDQRGVSLLLVEHDVELVMGLADQVYVLDFGQCIAHGTPAEISANPAVRAAYLGEEVAAVEGSGPGPNVGARTDQTEQADRGQRQQERA
jgi:branched-chain amino acid transport system ATP-binding protein